MIKLGDHVQNISKFTFLAFGLFQTLSSFKLSFCDSSPTLILTDGEDLKADKMSSTHPNLNPSYVIHSRSQYEIMGKTHFDIFSSTNCDT